MKKNKFSVFGMLAIALALGFVVVGCAAVDDKNNEPKTIIITGVNGKDPKDSRNINVTGMELYSVSIDRWPCDARAIEKIEGQTFTYELKTFSEKENWTGTGKYLIVIECYPAKDSSKSGSKYVYSLDALNPTQVDIKDAVTTLEWSKFIWVKDFMAG